MELVHEAVIERSKILEALGARFFKTFKEQHLRSGVDLFQELAQLSHGVTAGWNAKDIMYEAFDELLGNILAGQVAFRKFPRSQKLIEGYGLCGERDR